MRKLLILIAVMFLYPLASASAADYCDEKFEPGESPDGKAMLMMIALLTQALAKRYCGAAPAPITQTMVMVEEAHGCGPRARLEAEAARKIGQIGPNGLDSVLRMMLADMIESEDPTQADIDRAGREAIKEYGGCAKVLEDHEVNQQKYRDPPKWPRPPAE